MPCDGIAVHNLRAVDLNLLVVLEALIAERSATRAGARLGLSQPAVSGALARLRHLFGDALLVPTHRGLEPTGRALELAGPLTELLDRARLLIDGTPAFVPAALEREFRLGLSDYAAHLLLPALVARLGAAAPGVSVQVVDRVSGANAAELLDRKAVDLAVTVAPRATASVVVEALFSDGWCVCARADHPLWGAPLTPKALAGHPALLVSPEGDRYGIGDRLLGQAGLKRRVMLTLPQFLAAPAVLAGTDLVALLPARLAGSLGDTRLHMAELPFVEQPSFGVSLAWHRRDEADAAHAWLRQQLRHAAGERALGTAADRRAAGAADLMPPSRPPGL